MKKRPRNQASYENVPQPIRDDGAGGIDLGPRDVMRDLENPDMLVPPATDAGTVPNLKFSFSDTHMQLNHGGWSRQVTVRELPIATALAGVNMYLKPGGVRELHWHKQAEWAYMIWGRARITAVDQDGQNFIVDVGQGDLWYFPLEFHTRFKDWKKAANFCSSSTTAASLSSTPSLLPIGSPTHQRTC
jgi:oxalate decarboxylase